MAIYVKECLPLEKVTPFLVPSKLEVVVEVVDCN